MEGVSSPCPTRRVETAAKYVTAWCDGGYATNLALEDVTEGRAWLVHEYDGEPLDAEHGGPARLLVPHLYFWKSAKWVRGLALTLGDEPGFWETYGYHNTATRGWNSAIRATNLAVRSRHRTCGRVCAGEEHCVIDEVAFVLNLR